MIGRMAGNYRIVEKLGEGGMGAVYKGIDVMVEREVAIKVLRPEIARQPGVLERFRAEAVTLAKLNHPSIATLYSFFRHEDEYFMVMEFVPGRTLDGLLREWGPMPGGHAVRIFSQVLDGIHHAHAIGILHRDIKPANIMLTNTGAVKVTDFGIARVLGQARMTRQGNIVGTLEYIAPERIRGEEADLRSDIYSLGAVLYEMLSGRLPFERDNEFALMQAHLTAPVPPFASLGVGVPPPFETVLKRALAKKPEDRYQTAMEFRGALEAAEFQAASERPQVRPTRLAAPAAKETRSAVAGASWSQLPGVAPTQQAAFPVAPASLVRRLGWRLYAGAALLLMISAGIAAFLGGVFSPKPVSAPAAAGPGLDLPKDAVRSPAGQALQNSIPVPEPAPEGPPVVERKAAAAPRQERDAPSEEQRRRAALKALESGAAPAGGASPDAQAQEKERRRLEALKALEK